MPDTNVPPDAKVLADVQASAAPGGTALRDPVDAGLGVPERYARQTIFLGIGKDGQERLGAARVLIVGCGATGSVLANNLARAGVGYLRIVDRDYVEGNNLQRQVLYDEEDVLRGCPRPSPPPSACAA